MSRRYVVEIEVPDMVRDVDYVQTTIQHQMDSDEVLSAQDWAVRKVIPGNVQGIVDDVHFIRDQIEAV